MSELLLSCLIITPGRTDPLNKQKWRGKNLKQLRNPKQTNGWWWYLTLYLQEANPNPSTSTPNPALLCCYLHRTSSFLLSLLLSYNFQTPTSSLRGHQLLLNISIFNRCSSKIAAAAPLLIFRLQASIAGGSFGL